MDHMMERTAHRGMAGVTLGNEVFTDLDFEDDVALLAEMLEVLVLAMTIMQEEAAVFGLQISWSKTKILQVLHPCLAQHSRWQMNMLKWSTPLSIWVA